MQDDLAVVAALGGGCVRGYVVAADSVVADGLEPGEAELFQLVFCDHLSTLP